MFFKIGILKKFANFTGKTPVLNQALKLLLVMFAVNLAVGLDRYQG